MPNVGFFRTVEFHPDKLADFLVRQGQRVLYERAYRCACFDVDSYNKDIKCTLCDVHGYRYECPLPTRAIITGVQDTQEFTQVGTLKVGDAVGGFPQNVPVAFHDKVTLMNKSVREEEMFVNDPYFPPKLKDLHICQLGRARTLTRVFTPYQDYLLGVDGRTIVWNDPNNQPDRGEKFTIQYVHKPIYLVWQVLALERYSEDKRMPKHVILRRKDDFGNDLGRGTPSEFV